MNEPSVAPGLAEREATVHHLRRPGHPGRGVAGQEQRHVGDVLGLARTLQRLGALVVAPQLVQPVGGALRVAPERGAGGQRGGDEPGQMQLTRMSCSASSSAALRVSMTTPGLGHRVDVRADAGVDAADRGGRDDRAAALADHDRRGVLDAQEHALEQHVHGHVVLVGRRLVQRPHGPAEPGVVVQHVEAAPLGDGVGDGALELLLLGDVHPAEVDGVAQFGGEAGGHVLLQVGDHHLGALGHEQAHGGGTDAAGPTRDEGDLPVELAHPRLPLRVPGRSSPYLGARTERP